MRPARISTKFGLLLICLFATYATPATRLFRPVHNRIRQSASAPAPTVDLSYGRYQGYYESHFGLNVFKGCAAQNLPSATEKFN